MTTPYVKKLQRLKRVLKTELYDARIARRSNSSKCHRIQNARSRRPEVHVIQGIEELSSEHDLLRFEKPEALCCRSVDIFEARYVNFHSRRVAEAAGRGLRESRGVEPAGSAALAAVQKYFLAGNLV